MDSLAGKTTIARWPPGEGSEGQHAQSPLPHVGVVLLSASEQEFTQYAINTQSPWPFDKIENFHDACLRSVAIPNALFKRLGP